VTTAAMPRAVERILLIGDLDHQIQSALAQTLPAAHVTSVLSMFDAIAELSAERFTAVLAAAAPIERRPEAAVNALRELAGDGRLLLFGNPSFEPLSRKMLDFGCDDYLVTPASPAEIQQMLGAPSMRLTTTSPAPSIPAGEGSADPLPATPPGKIALLMGLPLADILLDAMVQHPNDSTQRAVEQISAHVAPTMQLQLTPPADAMPQAPDGTIVLSHAIRSESRDVGSLHLITPRDEDESAARHFLSRLAQLLSKASRLRDRHVKLQRLAFTDDLTGVYNGRFLRIRLKEMLEEARTTYVPVTLFLFDIDDFKRYNDQYGHGVGDEILRQTARLMKKCVREHDIVARISGDEFAVVFWEKDGPRQPRHPPEGAQAEDAPVAGKSRVPPSVRAVCDRFRKMVSLPEFQVLGTTGKGVLTISGGLAGFPYDATTAEGLIDAADRELVFKAKKSGKNTIFLVGEEPAKG